MEILVTPHPYLRHTAKPVVSWDKKIESEIAQMTTLLRRAIPEGVGLAATQVGLNRRLFILDRGKRIDVFINPVILETSSQMLSQVYKNPKKRYLEGCLSIPNIWGFVDRPAKVKLQYQLPRTMETVIADFTPADCSYVQHETDHLNGILFTDHILKQKGKLYRDTPHGLELLEI